MMTREKAGRRGKIEEAVAARRALVVDFVQAPGEIVVAGAIAEVAGDVEEALVRRTPKHLGSTGPAARELVHDAAHAASEFLVAQVLPGEADHRETLRQQPLQRKVVQGGIELAPPQVSRRAEDDSGTGKRWWRGAEGRCEADSAMPWPASNWYSRTTA